MTADLLGKARNLAGRLRGIYRRELRDIRTKTLASRLIHRPQDAFATHMPVLMGVSKIAGSRSILELGGGLFSTPALLNRDYFPSVDSVQTIEDDALWAEKIRDAVPDGSALRLYKVESVSEWVEQNDLSAYDLIFVDDSKTIPERARTLRAVCDRAHANAIVVVHDFEVRAYRDIAPAAGWSRLPFHAWRPMTGVLWRQGMDRRKLDALHGRLKRYQHISPADLTEWRRLIA